MPVTITDLVNPNTNPLPDEARDLVAALLEGRVRSMFLIAEIEGQDGETEWLEGYGVHMEGQESDTRAFVGAISLNFEEVKQAILDDALIKDIAEGFGGLDDSEDDEED